MKSRELDVFLGQEMNITTRDITFRKFKKRKDINDYHFVTCVSDIHFQSLKKPGVTLCISGPRLKPRIKDKIREDGLDVLISSKVFRLHLYKYIRLHIAPLLSTSGHTFEGRPKHSSKNGVSIGFHENNQDDTKRSYQGIISRRF